MTPKRKNTASNGFETLTPHVEPDKAAYQPYFDALDYAFSRDDVKNIAVTGSYGAGKSSIILSYLKMTSRRKSLFHRMKCFMMLKGTKKIDDHVIISLANFETDIALKDSESLSKEQSIEYSILQQILYKVDKGALPDSRVERIKTRSWWEILGTSGILFFVMILILFNYILLFPNKVIPDLLLPYELKDYIEAYPLWRISSILLLSFLICWSLLSRFYRVGFFDKKISLDKVNILKGEIGAEKQNTTSLLNLYIDEIVYFFHKTSFRVVIFEDLDRLNNGHIFIKLREINQVVNNSRLLEKRPIRFVFAVREDLLKDAESQTKFFDFIIPIIPAIDSENSFDILSTKISDFNEQEKDVFFKNISLYLTDMRVMNNVINEFKLFKRLIEGELSDIKLFSLLVYKNLCTKDFTKLDRREGLLSYVMTSYMDQTFHSLYYKDYEDSLIKLQENIINIENECSTSEVELRQEILNRFVPNIIAGHLNFYYNIVGQGASVHNLQDLIVSQDKFNNFFSSTQNAGIKLEVSGYGKNFQIPIEERRKIHQEYYTRLDLFDQKKKTNIDKINKDITHLRSVLKRRSHISLSELCQLITFDKFKNLLIVNETKALALDDSSATLELIQSSDGIDKNIEILFFMLSNGYLEQDYMQYRSIFHPGSLSHNDKIFIQKIASKLSFSEIKGLKLDNIENIYHKITTLSFKYYEGVLHPAIINYSLENKLPLAREILHHLVNNGTDDLLRDVVRAYYIQYEKGTYVSFVNILLSNSLLFGKLQSVILDEEDEINLRLITSIVTNGTLDNLRKQKNLNSLLSRLRKSTDILKHAERSSLSEFMSRLKQLNVIFLEVAESITQNRSFALKYIVDNSMYNFNAENLYALCNELLDEKITRQKFSDYPFTYVNLTGNESLKKNIFGQMDNFVKNMFVASRESLEVITNLLNEKISSQSKRIIIENMAFSVEDIILIRNEKIKIKDADQSLSIYEWLFSNGKVKPTWENIFHFISSDCSGDILWAYIEQYHDILLGEEIELPNEIEEKLAMHFSFMFNAPNISDELFERIVKTLPLKIASITDKLSYSRFEILCLNKRLVLTEELLRESLIAFNDVELSDVKKNFMSIIENNIDIFTENVEVFLKYNNEIDDELVGFILNNMRISERTKKKVLDVILLDYGEDVFKHLLLTDMPIIQIITMLDEDSDRINFLNYLLEFQNPSEDLIKAALNLFSNNEYGLVCDNAKRAKLEKKESNETLLKQLVNKSFISSFKDKGRFFEVYHHRRHIK